MCGFPSIVCKRTTRGGLPSISRKRSLIWSLGLVRGLVLYDFRKFILLKFNVTLGNFLWLALVDLMIGKCSFQSWGLSMYLSTLILWLSKEVDFYVSTSFWSYQRWHILWSAYNISWYIIPIMEKTTNWETRLSKHRKICSLLKEGVFLLPSTCRTLWKVEIS